MEQNVLWKLCKRGNVFYVRALLASGGGQVRDVPHVNVRGGDGVGNHGRDVLDVNVRGGRLGRTCLMVAVRRWDLGFEFYDLLRHISSFVQARSWSRGSSWTCQPAPRATWNQSIFTSSQSKSSSPWSSSLAPTRIWSRWTWLTNVAWLPCTLPSQPPVWDSQDLIYKISDMM